jgi:hypothetical protein
MEDMRVVAGFWDDGRIIVAVLGADFSGGFEGCFRGS